MIVLSVHFGCHPLTRILPRLRSHVHWSGVEPWVWPEVMPRVLSQVGPYIGPGILTQVLSRGWPAVPNHAVSQAVRGTRRHVRGFVWRVEIGRGGPSRWHTLRDAVGAVQMVVVTDRALTLPRCRESRRGSAVHVCVVQRRLPHLLSVIFLRPVIQVALTHGRLGPNLVGSREVAAAAASIGPHVVAAVPPVVLQEVGAVRAWRPLRPVAMVRVRVRDTGERVLLATEGGPHGVG